MKPQYGSPHIPFDLFTGKGFLFQITLVSGYNNYDECKFLANPAPVKIEGEEISEKSPENLQKIVTFLKENSPDLNAYGYRAWTDETNDFVLEVIRNTIPKGKIADALLKKSKSQNATSETDVSSESTVKTEDVNTEVNLQKDIPNLEAKNTSEPEMNLDDDEDFDDDLYAKL